MNIYKLTGQIIPKVNNFLRNLGFKNISHIESSSNRGLTIFMKDGLEAQIAFLQSGEKAIYWSIIDFESRAKELYITKNPTASSWEEVYNEDKFQEALNTMIDKHDANHGITWDTIDFWLNKMCIRIR